MTNTDALAAAAPVPSVDEDLPFAEAELIITGLQPIAEQVARLLAAQQGNDAE